MGGRAEKRRADAGCVAELQMCLQWMRVSPASTDVIWWRCPIYYQAQLSQKRHARNRHSVH